jgi:hypothetical protein
LPGISFLLSAGGYRCFCGRRADNTADAGVTGGGSTQVASEQARALAMLLGTWGIRLANVTRPPVLQLLVGVRSSLSVTVEEAGEQGQDISHNGSVAVTKLDHRECVSPMSRGQVASERTAVVRMRRMGGRHQR